MSPHHSYRVDSTFLSASRIFADAYYHYLAKRYSQSFLRHGYWHRGMALVKEAQGWPRETECSRLDESCLWRLNSGWCCTPRPVGQNTGLCSSPNSTPAPIANRASPPSPPPSPSISTTTRKGTVETIASRLLSRRIFGGRRRIRDYVDRGAQAVLRDGRPRWLCGQATASSVSPHNTFAREARVLAILVAAGYSR